MATRRSARVAAAPAPAPLTPEEIQEARDYVASKHGKGGFDWGLVTKSDDYLNNCRIYLNEKRISAATPEPRKRLAKAAKPKGSSKTPATKKASNTPAAPKAAGVHHGELVSDDDSLPVLPSKRKRPSHEEQSGPSKRAAVVTEPESEDGSDLAAVDEGEEEGDEFTWDPEAEALGAIEDEDAEYTPSASDAEPVSKGKGKGKAKAVPVQKVAGQRRSQFRLEPRPSSFEAIDIGKAGALPGISKANQVRALEEFERRMRHIIQFRHQLAANGGLRTMTMSVVRWWRRRSTEQIWKMVSSAISRERQLVLGGVPLKLYSFSDLPAPTTKELQQWLVYADLVDAAGMYTGSATACLAAGYGWRRLSTYEKEKRRSNNGEPGLAHTEKSAHLRMALQPGVTMELRVIGVFDPLRTLVSDVLTLEGIMTDFLGSLDTNLQEHQVSDHQTLEAIQAGQDALLDGMPKWQGLNRASPFLQGYRQDSFRKRVLEQQDYCCVLCEHQTSEGYRDWYPCTNHSAWLPFKVIVEGYCCAVCRAVFEGSNPPESLEELRGRRIRPAGEGNMSDSVHLAHFRRELRLDPEGVEQALGKQNGLCPVCDRPCCTSATNRYKGVHIMPDWMKPRFPEATFVCAEDWALVKGGNVSLEDVDHRVAKWQKVRPGETSLLGVTSRETAAKKLANNPASQEKYRLRDEQNNACFVCSEDLTKKCTMASFQGTHVVCCHPCACWFDYKQRTQQEVDERAATRTGR